VTRSVHHNYNDPVDLIWLAAAKALGITVVRSDEVYASWDGRGTLTVCGEHDYDADDSLAQLILHELCHALVQGPANRRKPDWGLDNTTATAGALEEHACHRLQAALLDLFGLRHLFGPTTDWRPYWDALPTDPLGLPSAGPARDPAIALARRAWPDAVRGPWSTALLDALRKTAQIAALTGPSAPPTSLWSRAVPLHPLGEAVGPSTSTCGDCAWSTGGPNPRCRHHELPIDATWQGCLRFEATLLDADCAACGACCREGYHVVGVEPDDTLLVTHPELVSEVDGYTVVPRPGGRCVALTADSGPPWRCSVYAHRPMACADFELNGDHCLAARKRVGLSRA
jgi:hypothetical protein